MDLVLFTREHPDDKVGDISFYKSELPFLSEKFRKIWLVPMSPQGENLNYGRIFLSYTNIDVIERHNCQTSTNIWKSRLEIISSKWFWQSILYDPSIFFTPKNWREHMHILGDRLRFKKWVDSFIKTEKINLKDTLFYTFWFNVEAEVLGTLALCSKAYNVVTRAHGYDLYDFRVMYRSAFFREKALGGLRKIYTASQAGENYLATLHPKYSYKIETAHLGINMISSPTFVPPERTDEVFRIVSCSFVVPVKRVQLLHNCLVLLAKENPDVKFEWTHIGGGEEFDNLKNQCETEKVKNLAVNLLGAVPHADVQHIYKNTRFDLGAHVSSSEGLPFAIMEMQYFCVPVIACAVGGVCECIGVDSGFLLPENITPEQFVHTVNPYVICREKLDNMGKIASKRVRQDFDSKKLRENFVNNLLLVSQEKR